MANDSPTTEIEGGQADYAQLAAEPGPRAAPHPRGPLSRAIGPLLTRIGETPRQASLLFSAQMASTAAGFLVATIQMHWMDPGQIGRYAFCLTLIVVTGLFFEFGLFPAGGRVLALLSGRESEKQALGAFLLLAAADGILFSGFIAVVAFPADWVFKQDVRWLLIGAAAAAFFLPGQRLVEESCQGLNRIRLLSEYRLTTAGLQLVSMAILGFTHRLTAASALLAYLLAMGPSAAITVARLGISFRGSHGFIKPIVSQIRSYGLNAYIAAMTGTASARLDNLVIAYLIGAVPLGLYFSAQRFSAALSTMARALAVTRFRAFAKLLEVPRRIMNWNTAAMIAGALLLALGGPLAIKLFFPRYAAAAPLFLPFAVLNLFLGLFQPYNMFLASHGRGAELRNIAAAVTVGTVVVLFVCVPAYGVVGAAWAGATAMLLDYLLHLYYYRRLKAELQRTESVQQQRGRNISPLRAGPALAGAMTYQARPALLNESNHTADTSPVLLLDLSNNPEGAMAWAERTFARAEIRSIPKADLKWGSKLGALAHLRLMRPRVFAVFCSDLRTQSAIAGFQIFGALAGARLVILADDFGRPIRCSRYRALLLAPVAFGFQLVIGYTLIAPLAWLFGLTLEAVSPAVKSTAPVESPSQSQISAGGGGQTSEPINATPRGRRGLYLRATASVSVAGGMATHVAGFAGGAAARGHRLDFISSGEVLGIDPASEVHLVPLSTEFSATRGLFELWNSISFTFQALKVYRRHCKNRRWEFIYQRYNRFNCAGALLSTVTGLPLLLEYNGSEVWVGRNWDPIGMMPLLKRFERVNQRRADLILVVSSTESLNLQALGIPADKIVINPNGVDVDEFNSGCGGDVLRRELGVTDKIVVGFLGSFGPWHGTDVLARAVVLTGPGSGCHFMFIGAGDLKEQTESIIAEGNCAESATFAGRVPHRSIARYLDACDILVAPHVPMPDASPYFGSPTKLFEYLAMAKPVVASRLGQMSEILVDGETALLVEPGDPAALADAILRLSKDEPLRRRLGAQARSLVASQYTWGHNAARAFAALEHLLAIRNHSDAAARAGGRASA